MDVYMGMIAALPYSFAPLGWLSCNGASLPVSSNAALYSLIGTTFGGDGITNFNLPDIRSRAIVGASITGNNLAPGLTAYKQGIIGGAESVTLQTPQIPAHTHIATITNSNAPVTGSLNATVNVGTTQANAAPSGNYLAGTTGGGDQMYTASKGATLNAGAVTVSPSGLNAALTNVPVAVTQTGGNLPHENRSPFISIQYCIATQGLYPTRP